jgi:hypothetical protein
MKWYPISLRCTPVRDETAFRGVKLGTKDRVTLPDNSNHIVNTFIFRWELRFGFVWFIMASSPPPLSSPWSTRQWKACWLHAWQATNHIIHHKDCVAVHGSMKSWRFLFCVFVLCCEPICQTGGTSCNPSTALVPQNMSGRQACLGLYLSADRDCTNLVSLMMTTTSSALEAGSEQSVGWRVFDFVHNHQSQFFLIFQNQREPSSSLSYFKPL